MKNSGEMTELIEPSTTVTLAEYARLEEFVLNIHKRSYAGMACCGSLPTGVDPFILAQMAARKPKNCVLLVTVLFTYFNFSA